MFASVPQIPIDLHDKEFLPILQEEPLPPLALVSFTEEEQVGAVVVAPKKNTEATCEFVTRERRRSRPQPWRPSWSLPVPFVSEATKQKAIRINNQRVLSSSTLPSPFAFAEKFFHVCKQCCCNAADRARRWANCRGGTERPEYLKR